MKTLILSLGVISSLFFSGISNALDVSEAMKEAKELFAQRGKSISYANQAASAYQMILDQVGPSDVELAATLHLRISEAKYYVGDHADNNSDKKALHLSAAQTAKDAFPLLQIKRGVPKESKYSTLLAELYYWYGANMGRWGEANGVLSSLKQWPEVQDYMEAIINMGEKEAVAYGANRILGRAYFKLPFPLGSKSKSLNYLKEAVEKTLHSTFKISHYAINNLYYAETLIKQGHKKTAKQVLELLVAVGEGNDADEKIKNLNPERIPETIEEIEIAKDMLKKLN